MSMSMSMPAVTLVLAICLASASASASASDSTFSCSSMYSESFGSTGFSADPTCPSGFSSETFDSTGFAADSTCPADAAAGFCNASSSFDHMPACLTGTDHRTCCGGGLALNAKSGGLVTRLYATSSSALLADAPTRSTCNPMALANLIILICSASSADDPSKECCATLVQMDHLDTLQCLCDAAAGPEITNAGYTIGDVLSWYSACAGRFEVDHSDLVSTCSSRQDVERNQQLDTDELEDVSRPPPPVAAQTQAPPSRPRPVVVVYREHPSSGWPWWGVVAAIFITMVFILMITYVCAYGCGRLTGWIAGFLMWVYTMGRSAAHQDRTGRPTTSSETPSTTRDLVPETGLTDLPATGEAHGLAVTITTTRADPAGEPPTTTVVGVPVT